jgi:hypothetical protein
VVDQPETALRGMRQSASALAAPVMALLVLSRKLLASVVRASAEVVASTRVAAVVACEVWSVARRASCGWAKLSSSAIPWAIWSWRAAVLMNCCRRVTPVLKSAASVVFWSVKTAAWEPMPTVIRALSPAANDWSPMSQSRCLISAVKPAVAEEESVLFEASAVLEVSVLFEASAVSEVSVLFDASAVDEAVLLSADAESSTELAAELSTAAALFDPFEAFDFLAASAPANAAANPPAALPAPPPLATVVDFWWAGAAATEVTAIKAKRAAVNFIV